MNKCYSINLSEYITEGQVMFVNVEQVAIMCNASEYRSDHVLKR